MKLPGKLLLLCTIAISMALSGCSKDEVQAENSIQGGWDIIEINSTYADFTPNGYSPDSTITETGALGTFDFLERTVTYSFTRHNSLYTGNVAWEISAEKVNSGFTRVTQFTLTIDGQFLFDVVFEDATKNSEKNATTATFTETPGSGYGVLIQMSLEKR